MVAFVSALATASAQTPGHNLTVKVPFEFSVGDKTLPAGDYLISRLSSDGTTVRISNQESDRNIARQTRSIQSSQPKEQSVLVFRRYGDQYFLAQVWLVGETTGREITPSASEKSLDNELAKNNEQAQTVTVIAALH
jgi:hypothetical protein